MSGIGGLDPIRAVKLKENTIFNRGKELQNFNTKIDTALGKEKLTKEDYKAIKDSMTDGRKTLDSFLSSVGVPEKDITEAFSKGNKGEIMLSGTQKTQLRKLLSRADNNVLQIDRDNLHKELISTKYNNFASTDDVEKFVKDRKAVDKDFNFSQVAKFVPFETQRKLETAIMTKTITNAGSDAKTSTMQKIFFAMNKAGLQMKDTKGNIKPFPYELASALSHGNRVCFLLPPGQEKEFNAWLKSGLSNERKVGFAFTGSSHGIQPDTTAHFGFKETKGLGVNVAFRDKNEDFGVNIAVGGKEEKSINGDTISDNGHFGHLLLVTNDNQNPSVTMVGVENSKPGKNDQWGGSHSIDCHRNAVSATGSQKWGDIDSPDGTPETLGGLVVDLRNTSISSLINSFKDFPKDKDSLKELCNSKQVKA